MKKDPQSDISALLAIRDGEPHAADFPPDDPTVARQLERLRALKSDLQELPDVPLGDALWKKIDSTSKPPRRREGAHWLRYPLATAASVFLISLVGIYLIFNGFRQQPDAQTAALPTSSIQGAQTGLHLAGLMHRSRQLELRLQGAMPVLHATDTPSRAAANAAAVSGVERQLMGRLADVDAQIATMFENGVQDPGQRERLWSQRVSLLESLVAVRGGQISDLLLDEGRSM